MICNFGFFFIFENRRNALKVAAEYIKLERMATVEIT